jgi:regulatory protein
MRDAYSTALKLLSARELSEAQLRTRLVRRQCDPDDVERTLERLRRDGAVDDRRVARATARVEALMRHRGRSRALQQIRHLGIDADVAQRAVDDVFADIDETNLLDRAIDRRLKGAAVSSLDRRATARIVRALLAQGFQASAILKQLRARGTVPTDEGPP